MGTATAKAPTPQESKDNQKAYPITSPKRKGQITPQPNQAPKKTPITKKLEATNLFGL